MTRSRDRDEEQPNLTVIRGGQASTKRPPSEKRTASALGALRGIRAAIERVEDVVGAHFAELLGAVKALLTLEAISCFEDIRRPLLLFFVGVPSSGKTQVIEFATPRDDADPLASYCYRSDKVTPKAFVSNRADLSPAQLGAVDLLPKIKDRLLLTKELSPFFQGHREQLLETFAVLASISDGTGFVVDTGAHGRRGYPEPINFRWCGATTPLSTEALHAMEVIGPRVLFYYVGRPRKTDAELVVDIQHRRRMPTPADVVCHEAVREFITTLHDIHPPRSVRRSDIDFPRPALAQIARWGNALILLRGSPEVPEAGREHPERVVEQLEVLATASAHVHGRTAVTDQDLALVAHVACSSGVGARGHVLRALLASDGEATTRMIEEHTRLSTKTVLKYMEELAAVGLATCTRGAGRVPARIALSKDFTTLRWCGAIRVEREGARAREDTTGRPEPTLRGTVLGRDMREIRGTRVCDSPSLHPDRSTQNPSRLHTRPRRHRCRRCDRPLPREWGVVRCPCGAERCFTPLRWGSRWAARG